MKKHGKEPEKLEFSLKAPKGYENTLDKKEAERARRRAMLEKQFNKIKKDPF
jgi:hypothetical protein